MTALLQQIFWGFYVQSYSNSSRHHVEELCEAGSGVITASLVCLSAEHNVCHGLLMHAVPLTFRQEAREEDTMSQMISALFLPFFHFLLWHTILLCLTWSPFTVSLLFVSSGSGSYSNPFLHASDRQILSLLRCCSTWQGIRLGTPFAIQVIHNLCTFAHFFLNENPPQKTKQSWLLRCSFVALDLWRQIKYPSTCCQHSSAIRP